MTISVVTSTTIPAIITYLARLDLIGLRQASRQAEPVEQSRVDESDDGSNQSTVDVGTLMANGTWPWSAGCVDGQGELAVRSGHHHA
jgi:hypothetical protein